MYKFLAIKHHNTRNKNSLGLAQQTRSRDNFWAIGTLVLTFLQLFYLLIWEFFGFIQFFHQLNLGVSDISTNIHTGFTQQHDGFFQPAGSVLKGGSVMYWYIALVEGRWTWNLDSEILDSFINSKPL